jgi:hypothetical protein
LGIAARETFVDEISDRTSEMTRDRQKSDPEFLFIGRGRVLRTKNVEINRRMQQRDERKPPDCDYD